MKENYTFESIEKKEKEIEELIYFHSDVNYNNKKRHFQSKLFLSCIRYYYEIFVGLYFIR